MTVERLETLLDELIERNPEPDLYLTGAVNQISAGAVPFKVVPRILRAVADSRK